MLQADTQLPGTASADADGVRIEPTATGQTLSLRTPDGRWIRLHSGRDPVAEADRKIAELMADGEPPLLICIGLGLGYLLDAIERRSSTTRVLALEPHSAVARAMLARRTWEDWTASGRLTLLIGPDYAGAADAARRLGAHNPAPIIVAPTLEREFGAVVAEARKALDHALFGARANEEARREFAPRYLLNTIRNIPVIAASADASALDGAFPEVPAVVIAAGPSLDRNIDELRRLRGRALFIAVDTALRPLLDAGIVPELVVAVDPSEVNGRHLHNLPETPETWLVAEASLDPAAFEQFAGRTFTFSVSDHQPWPWLRSLGLGRGRLRAWGSVITSAFDLALRGGCDPIVFAGADLAYPEKRPYCRGTTYEHDWAMRAAGGESLADIWQSAVEARAIVTVDDVAGHPVATAGPLVAFRDWLVEQSANCGDRQIFNATGGGALVGGRIQQRTLAEALVAGEGSPAARVSAVRAAWSRGRMATTRATAPAGNSALRSALAVIADTPAAEEPIASWLKFGSPDLTSDALRSAIAAAADPPQRAAAQIPVPSSTVEGLRYAPERVMAIRAVLLGERISPTASSDNPQAASPEPPATALARAGGRLMALVRTTSLLDPDPSSSDTSLPRCVPATRDFSWSGAATNFVLEYETALAEMLACRYVPGDPQIGEALDRVRVMYEDRPGTGEGRTCLVAADGNENAAPRLALIGEWLDLVARWDDRPGTFLEGAGRAVPLRVGAALVRAHAEALRSGLECVSSERVIDLLTGALVSAPASVEPVPVPSLELPGLSIAVSTGDSPDTTPASISIGLRRSNHFAVDAPGPPWLRAARTGHPRAWVRPIRLPSPELPPCMVGETLDEGHALFTIVNGTHSVRIDASGRWQPDAEWPMPITGQVRWGAAGAVAWHNGTSRVIWRERPGGKVRSETMPLSRGRAFPQPDGSFWWTSTRAGLWSWTPGGAWQCLVDTPPVLGLQVGTDGVRLDPRGDSLDYEVRSRLTEAFLWQPGSVAFETIPIGAEGPCWSTSANGEWTALAYPHVDAILLRNRTGVQHTLTCSYPFNVAWAGTSLVASTGRAEVIVFPDLIGWLQEARRLEGSGSISRR